MNLTEKKCGSQLSYVHDLGLNTPHYHSKIACLILSFFFCGPWPIDLRSSSTWHRKLYIDESTYYLTNF